MAKVILKDSEVVFDKANHTYELNGKMLSGVTEMLQRQLFSTEYQGIPWSIVKKAGEYGSLVHDACEAFDSTWINNKSQELQDYIALCKQYGFTHEKSEYTVTDYSGFASNIDKVFRVSEDTFDLADIKTYCDLTADKLEKARWQLSLYAYFFQLVNPKAKIGRLAVIHIRNKQKKDGSYDHISEVIFVERIPTITCKKLLEAELNGEQFQTLQASSITLKVDEVLIRKLLSTKAEIDEQLSYIKQQIYSDMEAIGETKYQTPTGLKIVRKADSIRSSFDLKAFTADNPKFDLTPYMKESKVSGSLSIAI